MNKKNILYMAMAACVALTNVACSSDDDSDNENYSATLNTPKYENEAVAFSIPETATITTSIAGAPAMTGVNITESGQVVFELGGGKTFKTYNIESISGNTYTLADRRGTIVRKSTAGYAPTTRSSSGVLLIINVTIELDNGESCSYNTGDDAVSAEATKPATGSEVEKNLCRTWIIKGVVIEYKEDGKDAVFKEFNSGNLKEVAEYANDQGAGLTASEMRELDRNVSNVVVDKSGLIVINYTNRASDAAKWVWKNNEQTQLGLKLKDSEMGNKFLSDNTVIDIAFKDTRCVLKLKTRVTGNKNYNVALSMRLQSKD
jgi:hypothetical protein